DHQRQQGRDPRRAQADPRGGAQRHGADRPRGPDPAPLRAPEQRRDRAGARPEQEGGQQPVYPGAEAAQGDPLLDPRHERRVVTSTSLPTAVPTARSEHSWTPPPAAASATPSRRSRTSSWLVGAAASGPPSTTTVGSTPSWPTTSASCSPSSCGWK